MDVRKNGPAHGAGSVLAAAVLWGTVGPAQVLASSPMTPAALGGWRLLVGGLVLGAFTVRPARVRALAGRTVLLPLVVCALSTGIYQAAFLSSVERTGAALATVIALGTAPAATGLCARWATGERVGSAWLVSTAAAVAGCALLMAPGNSRVDPLGLLLAVTAGTCYGLYTVFAKKLAAAAPADRLPALSALSLLAGSLPLLPSVVTDAAAVRHGTTLALIAWLGVATTAVAYRLFTAGLRHVRATTAGTLSLAEPLAAAVIGSLLLHEHLTPAAWAGCALILAGTVHACLPAGRRTRQDAGRRGDGTVVTARTVPGGPGGGQPAGCAAPVVRKPAR
ncbi:drug/metabolite transporter, DME family [Actinacidiphila yanglinensis]|uniref:Drug/metabolite transporter, DME family n=1 Tax=Actinacidiphila yanglinensis TaxID=310779 RepID=A0A1H6D727_9ACTN|nr:EamA family transporter [Actinacidiphila yanglinensis]SEG80874.1 drug/metabolite transporter, DME family [Actinacidiphila yanglinensis]